MRLVDHEIWPFELTLTRRHGVLQCSRTREKGFLGKAGPIRKDNRQKESYMFVRLVRFSFGPGKQAAAQNLANDLVPAIQARPGCQAVTFFGDDQIFFQWVTGKLEKARISGPASSSREAPPKTGRRGSLGAPGGQRASSHVPSAR